MPKLVLALVIWFMWATGKDLDALARFSITSDYYILSHAGLAPLFFVMGFAVLLANASALFYLFKPSPVGIKVLYAAFAVAMLQNAITLSLALRDLDGVREVYARGREIRGLPVREDALNMIFSSSGMITTFVVMVVFYAVLAVLAQRSKNYFIGSSEIAA